MSQGGQDAWGPGSIVASRFRLEDLLDERSGARFWRATDLTLARNVAIHVIAAQDRRASAVLTAARTSATVSEPRLLRVLDAVQEDDVVHVVHEWGSGMSLDRMVAEEPLAPRRAAWLVREVAQTIAATHAQGVAHGRLLPENVLVSDAGSVKLIGFVVDAVLYGRLSPEDLTGDLEGVHLSDHENDVRNLGALLYTALVGRWPGRPASVVPDAPLDHGQVCRPRQVRAGVPRELDTLCRRLLRVQENPSVVVTASSVAEALSRYLGEGGPHAVTNVSAATAFLAPDALTGPGGTNRPEDDSLGSHDLLPTQASGAPFADPEATQASPQPRWDLDDTGAGPAGRGAPAADPEATQAAPSASPRRAGPAPGAGHDADPSGRTQVVPVPDRATPPRDPRLGMGAGAVPQDWGPDADDTGSLPVLREAPERPGSSWMRLGAALAGLLLLVLTLVVVANLGGPDLVPGGEPSDEPTPEASAEPDPPQPVPVASISDFDPEQDGGTPEENPELLPLAVDGRPGTVWETETYFDGPALPPYKSGVGLLLDLGQETEVTDVVAQLPGAGYSVQLLAAGEGAGAPTTATGLDRVATQTGVGGRVVLAPDSPVTTRYLVLWLTALPSVDGGYQGQVAEVVVRS
ncbi:hypothetical protein G7072_17710 [Nocardioides sp. HDW12B]|uniref:protein kinase domain-containing protein n=1 Tax=Nocardioides sp. HDW12B TaxID=2714939 RepID=UPI00140B508C|nr:protein kinase [Nocardioides sp. HDW12B]QIK67932.1 hypothetical protein G7072_17710 [Nocardioides sp. HDW12B]